MSAVLTNLVEQVPTLLEMREQVTQLHPERNQQDVLPERNQEFEGELIVNGNTVRRWINGAFERDEAAGAPISIPRLKVDASAGNDGWTNKLLVQVSSQGVEDQDASPFHNLVADLFNLMYSDSLPTISRDIAVMVRSVLLPKPNGGFRPLGIASSIFRLASRIAAGHYEHVADLSTMQLAITVKNGVTIGSQKAQLAYDEGYGILSLDIRNGFNVTRHLPVYNALAAKPALRGLIPFFRFAYDKPAELWSSSGELVGTAATGLRQGDNLASLYFCLVIDPCLQEIAQTLHGAEQGPNRTTAVSAYIDDVNFRGPPELIIEYIPHILQVFFNAGLPINQGKSCFFSRQGDIFPLPDGCEIPSTDCCKILGTPVGPEAYRREWLVEHICNSVPSLPTLRLLPPSLALTLVTLCYNPTVVFLMRAIAQPSLLFAPLQAFDKTVDDVLAGVLGLDKDASGFGLTRSIPRREGGLGIPYHYGWNHELQCLLGQTATLLSIGPAAEDPLHGAPERLWPAVVIGACQEFTEEQTGFVPERITDILSSNRPAPEKLAVIKDLARNACRRAAQHQQSIYLAQRRDENPAHAAWLTSMLGDGGTLSFTTAPDWLADNMSDAEFLDAIRLAFGQPIIANPLGQETRCTCTLIDRPRLEDPAHFSHALSCHKNKNYFTAASFKVEHLLARFLKTVRPGTVIEKQPVIGHRILADGTLGGHVIGDILVTLPSGEKQVIDVALVDNTSRRYLDRADSHMVQNGAASFIEAEKRAKYTNVSTASGQRFNLDRFVPFVVERTGRLGTAAISFLNHFTVPSPPQVHATALRSQLFKSIAFWMAVFNGRMIGDTRRRALQAGQPAQGG